MSQHYLSHHYVLSRQIPWIVPRLMPSSTLVLSQAYQYQGGCSQKQTLLNLSLKAANTYCSITHETYEMRWTKWGILGWIQFTVDYVVPNQAATWKVLHTCSLHLHKQVEKWQCWTRKPLTCPQDDFIFLCAFSFTNTLSSYALPAVSFAEDNAVLSSQDEDSVNMYIP